MREYLQLPAITRHTTPMNISSGFFLQTMRRDCRKMRHMMRRWPREGKRRTNGTMRATDLGIPATDHAIILLFLLPLSFFLFPLLDWRNLAQTQRQATDNAACRSVPLSRHRTRRRVPEFRGRWPHHHRRPGARQRLGMPGAS